MMWVSTRSLGAELASMGLPKDLEAMLRLLLVPNLCQRPSGEQSLRSGAFSALKAESSM